MLKNSKVLQHGKPFYLANLVYFYNLSRALRYSNCLLLNVPEIRTVMGQHSFTFAASTIWNSLPYNLRAYPNISIFCSKPAQDSFLSSLEVIICTIDVL